LSHTGENSFFIAKKPGTSDAVWGLQSRRGRGEERRGEGGRGEELRRGGESVGSKKEESRDQGGGKSRKGETGWELGRAGRSEETTSHDKMLGSPPVSW
jgi:hypothetical protein